MLSCVHCSSVWLPQAACSLKLPAGEFPAGAELPQSRCGCCQLSPKSQNIQSQFSFPDHTTPSVDCAAALSWHCSPSWAAIPTRKRHLQPPRGLAATQISPGSLSHGLCVNTELPPQISTERVKTESRERPCTRAKEQEVSWEGLSLTSTWITPS